MWYFTWILGVTAALAFGVINVMWYEACDANDECGLSEEEIAAKRAAEQQS